MVQPSIIADLYLIEYCLLNELMYGEGLKELEWHSS